MITCRISGNSSSVIADMESAMATYSTVSSTNWKSFSYASTAGAKYWKVWAEHYDATADELVVVYSDGCAAPDLHYEYVTTTQPTLTGHTLTYPAVNASFSSIQSPKGSRSGGSSASSVPVCHIRLAPDANITTDFMAVVQAICLGGNITGTGFGTASGQTNALSLFYYTTAAGEKEWNVWAIIQTSITSNTNNSLYIISMDGIDAPGTGSDRKAFAVPQTGINNWNTANTNTQFALMGVPMRVFVSMLR